MPGSPKRTTPKLPECTMPELECPCQRARARDAWAPGGHGAAAGAQEAGVPDVGAGVLEAG
eukprot:7466724-Alexandrium_andersonii.AAC.1